MHFRYAIALLLLLNINSVKLNAQEYQPMNFDNGRWFVEVFEYGGYVERIQMYCSGDTTIDSQLYSKLFQNKLIRIPPGEFFTDTVVGEYVGAIRNNDNRQVVFRSVSADTFATIYDFNLSIGDTINGLVEDFVINSIDSVEYCGIYHKRYVQYLNGGSYDETLIEGIGFSNGLLGYFYHFDNGGENTRVLKCYTEKDNPQCDVCEILLDIVTSNFETTIYPIPAENILTIKSSKPICQLRLISISGTEALFSTYNNQLFVQESIEDFLPGLYLVEILFADYTKRTSVIIKN